MIKRLAIFLAIFFTFICLNSCTPIFYTEKSGLGDPANPPVNHFYTRNIWNTLASDFSLPDETPENPQVRAQINWYMRNQLYLIKVAEQSKPYLYYIYQQVKRRHLPAELALLPMIESNYDPFAYSKVGASGLWQMMPGTASGFGIKVDWWYDGRRDIIASTNAALNYLSYLGTFFDGQWLLAIAAYDTGEGTVNQAIQRNAKAEKSTDFWALALSKETQGYVPKLLALATIIKHPDEYPIDLPDIPAQPYLAAVDIGSQIDLSRAATMAHMSLQKLSDLNPGFNRWATDPQIPTTILLPIDRAEEFEQNLNLLPDDQRVTWVRYQIKPNDNLLTIAKKYKTTLALLKEVNKLKSNNLHIGQTLLIPTETSTLTKIVLNSEQRYFSSIHSKLPEVHITNYAIQHGDSLDSIARKFDVKVREIRFWNGLKEHTSLKPGTKLILWPPKRHFAKQTLMTTYKIKSGDSLSSIAHAYHTSVDSIRKMNHFKHNTIRVGKVIQVPVKAKHYFSAQHHRAPKRIIYHVKSGDTITGIAKRFHVSLENLTRWNRLSDPHHLKINQALVMYL